MAVRTIASPPLDIRQQDSEGTTRCVHQAAVASRTRDQSLAVTRPATANTVAFETEQSLEQRTVPGSHLRELVHREIGISNGSRGSWVVTGRTVRSRPFVTRTSAGRGLKPLPSGNGIGAITMSPRRGGCTSDGSLWQDRVALGGLCSVINLSSSAPGGAFHQGLGCDSDTPG